MLEILKWMHASVPNYLSTWSILLFLALCTTIWVSQLSKIGRPRKHVKHSINDTQNL